MNHEEAKNESTTEQTVNAEGLGNQNLDEVNGILDGALNSFNEDELRARVRHMKEKLVTVNKSLKDIEEKREHDSDDKSS